jgi:hypothetical protein
MIAILMTLAIAPTAWSTVILDTARDLHEAAGIVAGDHWPLRGPVINAMAHLGPVWFYLLAVPLALTGSIAATLLFAGLLGALKFPLAYALGRKLGGNALGLAFAMALALPGWNSIALLLVSHTNLVETMMLATMFPLLALARGGASRWWIAYGLLQTLALHAHPATVICTLLLPIVCWRRRARWRADAGPVAAGLAVAIGPFLPVVIAEWRDGWPMVAATAGFAEARAAAPWFDGVLDLFRGITLGGVNLVARDFASSDLEFALHVLFVFVLIVCAFGAGAMLMERTAALRLLSALALATLALLALALLRTETPYYMALVWLPFAAWPLALGLARALETPGISANLARVAIAAILLLHITASALLIRRAEQGLITLPAAALGNVRLSDVEPQTTALLPAWRFDALGADICVAPRRTILHGELALLVDAALALSVRLQCADPSRVGIGGGAGEGGARHLVGLTPRQLARAGYGDSDWNLALSLAPLRVVAADTTQAVADGTRYPFREPGAGTPRTHMISFVAPARAPVVVTHPFFVYDGARTRAIRANGHPAELLSQTRTSEVYAARTRAASVHWEVEVETGFPERIDIVIAPPPIVSRAVPAPEPDR